MKVAIKDIQPGDMLVWDEEKDLNLDSYKMLVVAVCPGRGKDDRRKGVNITTLDSDGEIATRFHTFKFKASKTATRWHATRWHPNNFLGAKLIRSAR